MQATTEFVWPTTLDLPGYHPVTRPHSKQVREAARLILESRKPVLYVGGGVIRAGASDRRNQVGAGQPRSSSATRKARSRAWRPTEIRFGWSNESPMAANLQFVLFGEGNVPWMVRELILKAEHDVTRQPRVIIG